MQRSSAHGAICLKPFVVNEAWKAVRTCSPWEVHTKSPSCDAVVRCIRVVYGRSGVLPTWTQVPYGFRKVHIWVPYGSVRMTYRLGNIHTISRAGSTEPASGLYEARESPCEPHRIQLTCRLRKEHIRSPHDCPWSFTGPKS